MKVHSDAFTRIRSRIEALNLSDGDRSGPLLVRLDAVAREAAKEGIASRGNGLWAPLSPRYAAWKAAHGFGSRMMVMAKPYRGRGPAQLQRKFTLAKEAGHIKRWVGGMRYQFGADDDVAAIHEAGTGLPRRSVVDSIFAAQEQFVSVLKVFWIARVRQVLRHS